VSESNASTVGFRAEDRRRHFIAGEIFEGQEAGVSSNTVRRVPWKKIDHVGTRIAVDPAKRDRLIVCGNAAP
jgi:hypothetical protein